MNFLIRNPKNHNFLKVTQIDDLSDETENFNLVLYLENFSDKHYKIIKTIGYEIIVIGDLFFEKTQDKSNLTFNKFLQDFKPELIRNAKGFFYLIIINLETKSFLVINSVFSILPVYYHQNKDFTYVSSSTMLIKKFCRTQLTINKQYILEKILFNYPWLNDTLFNEIQLLPSNSYLKIDKKINIEKHTHIHDFFSKSIQSGNKTLNYLVDTFLQTSENYFPDEKVSISFTGGFDGRTLVATALYLNKRIDVYSFGSHNCDDILIPFAQAPLLNIEFTPIYLENHYINDDSYQMGLDLILISEGNASLSRAHYVHAAKTLSQNNNYIITGNFGSELFRAMHNAGVMLSSEAIAFFTENKKDNFLRFIHNSPKIKYLNLIHFQNEIDIMIDKLWQFKQSYRQDLSLNEKFYVFVFEEILRKYFGPEIVMQFHFLKNRTPFLDFAFIENLLKTKYAGVYSNFRETNLVNRFKGQLLYAKIMEKTDPILFKMYTGKGYRPKDILTLTGKVNLLKASFNKYKKQHKEVDPYSVLKCFEMNAKRYSQFPINEYFNRDQIRFDYENEEWRNNSDIFISTISLNYYINSI